jgi:hypothetical protein
VTARARALVVRESMFGNTARLAAAVADGLRSDGYSVEVHGVDDAPSVEQVDVDLLVVGAPTHPGAPGVREWLEAGRGRARPVRTACLDTRVDRAHHLPGSAARRSARLAREAGLEPVPGTESFYVDDVAGPLLPGELSRAARWGRHLAPHHVESR